ncbi:hypothetical protein ACMXYX_06845 [Neptuniibacter sp. QD72_48]|uniref:hypothetical protein n=1 Tax=unclassified Neptuniibacter TaxID=2630693 RepID=UPI0039F60791
MFNRIFQDCSGSIDQLEGSVVSALYTLDDANTGNIFLIWLQVAPSNKWYRIFIDGWYCGIDAYEECMVEDDKDDDVLVQNLTSEYENQSIVTVQVSDPRKPNYHIVLSIQFQTSSIELVCKAVDGDCVLVKNA